MKTIWATTLRWFCLTTVLLGYGHFHDGFGAPASDSFPPANGAPSPSADPVQADLLAKIITLKTLLSTAPPEALADLMCELQDLEQQLAERQGSIPPPANAVPPGVPGPDSSVDPAQADLIAQIINLKSLLATTTSPEDHAGILGKIDDLERQLAVLQGSAPASVSTVPPSVAEPVASVDPAQAELMAQIIALKDSFPSAAASEDPIAFWNKLLELEERLEAMRESNPPSNVAPPGKPDPAQPVDLALANAAGANKRNQLSIASNQNGQTNAQSPGNLIAISWNGGPGIILQTAGSLGNAGWRDVPDTEGKSRVDLPVANTGTFFRAVKR